MYTFPDELRKAYESQPVALVYDQLIDGKVVPLLVSDGFCELVGMDREHAMAWFREGQFERIHPDDVGRVARVSEEFANHRSGYDLVFRTKHADGYHIIHAVGEWQTMPDGTELALLTYADLTANIDAMSGTSEDYRLFRQDHFYTDPLTGLPNLNYLNEYGDERVHALRISGKHPVILYADVLAMHFYNSQYGYEKGNDLLRQVAATLTETFPGALVVRGQDDHLILIDTYDDREKIEEKITSANNRIRTGAEGNTVGLKTGICVYEEQMQTVEALDHARNALKWIGNDLNRVCNFYTYVDEDQLWNQRYIIENFDRAMAEGWIKVYYQGIVRVETGKGSAFEALARWVDPVRGILSPNEFIPVLKKYHLLHKLDLFVAEQVCREYPLRVSDLVPILPVSVNFSAQDFDYADIPAALEEIYRRYQVPDLPMGRSLVVEITEQDMARAKERFQEQIRELRKNRFRIWLDDFGSGYSSLNAFSSYDVDLIKFDMELLKHLDDYNGANRLIMKAMTGIARELGIHTLAEGMETTEQKIFLQEIGCELAQGYLYHRPEPIAAMIYRRNSGQKPRPFETADERERMNEKWYHETAVQQTEHRETDRLN